MSGIDSNGFTPKTTEDIKTDLEGRLRASFGNAISLIPQSVFGQLVGIFSDLLADAWQLGLAIYNGAFRDGASGVNLDLIGALTGTIRKDATYSEVTLTLTGTPGTVIAAGKIAKVPSSGFQFANDGSLTIGGGGTVSGPFTATETGPKPAYAGTVTEIVTPVSGWSSVTNAADHTQLGTDIETDAVYRLRQEADLRAIGKATTAAIRSAVLAVDNVADCYVFENETDGTDAEGLPPHSIECVVDGGTTAAVAQSILDTKPVGIATHGSTTQAATDANGFSRNIKFSRPADLNVYIDITVKIDAALFPTNGADTIKQAVADWGDLNIVLGTDLYGSAMVPTIFDAVPGIIDVSPPELGLSVGPTLTAAIVTTNRQKAKLDTARITVTTTT